MIRHMMKQKYIILHGDGGRRSVRGLKYVLVVVMFEEQSIQPS